MDGCPRPPFLPLSSAPAHDSEASCKDPSTRKRVPGSSSLRLQLRTLALRHDRLAARKEFLASPVMSRNQSPGLKATLAYACGYPRASAPIRGHPLEGTLSRENSFPTTKNVPFFAGCYSAIHAGRSLSYLSSAPAYSLLHGCLSLLICSTRPSGFGIFLTPVS